MLIFSFCSILTSCKKIESSNNNSLADSKRKPYLPSTIQEKETVKLIVNAKEIIKKVYQNPNAVQEVLSAINSKRRLDESIYLEDLLKYKESKVYSLSNIKHAGTFAREFEKYAPKNIPTFNGDSTNQVDYYTFANSNINIYFPYSENYNFDSLTQERISLAAAQADSDEGPGEEPIRIDQNNVKYYFIRVNDAYAEVHPTHIVGVTDSARVLVLCPDPNDPDCGGDPDPKPLAKRVYVGRVKLVRQLDVFISFTGNGGGSEIKFCHLTGYLQPVEGHVETFQDVNHLYFSRKDIRKERTKSAYSIWDDDWEVDDREQVLAVYEEDNKSTITFTGSLSTTLVDTIAGAPINVAGSIGFTIERKSQDEIIKQLKISRSSYFTFAKADQGCGFDSDFKFGFNWPLIDWPTCGNNANIFGYTMPYQQL